MVSRTAKAAKEFMMQFVVRTQLDAEFLNTPEAKCLITVTVKVVKNTSNTSFFIV